MSIRPARLALCLIALSVAGSSRGSAAVSEALQRSLHQIFVDNAFDPPPAPRPAWLDGGSSYTVLEKSSAVPDAQDLVRYATESGKREVLVPAQALIPQGQKKPLRIEDYSLSTDKHKLLIFTDTQRVWRLHTRGDYWVYDLDTHALHKLGGEGAPSSMQFAKFSPDGSQIGFVREHNLFVQELSSMHVRALTRDGSQTIINGTSDWVYEEELDLHDGFRWSPDGKRIAFWHFDSIGVGDYPLIDYTDSIYPTIRVIPYPKAGTTNSAVSIGVVEVRSGKTKWMNVPGDPRNNYIADMNWAGNSDELVIEQLNRLQNTARLVMAQVATGKTRQFFEDTDRAWVDVYHENAIRPLGDSFLWLSERDGWRHAYLAHRNGSAPTLLTPGNYDVIEFVSLSEKQRALYFTASPGNATQSYLYRAATSGGPAQPVRITPDSQPGFHMYNAALDGEWAVERYSRFDDLWRAELIHLSDGHPVRSFTDTAELRKKLEPLLENRSEFFQLNIGNGVILDGWMIRPRNFTASRKYPVLVYVYGEPAAQTVLDMWPGRFGLWFRALAEDGYIVVSFDNRGTPAPKGREWRKVIYGSIGPLAAEEQTKAIRKLCSERPYLDAERVAVWGWSGGATDTLNMMFRSPDVFKVGMAVAPVPDQRLYDTIYQERYMGLPQDNPDGYKRGSAINFAAGLKGRLLLVHGTGDDNVHFQGSQMLINKFVELGKQFSFMEYPNRTHSISEGNGTTIHLMTLLSNFLEDNLPREANPPESASAAHP